MAGKTVFNSINGRLILEDDAIVIEQSLVHRFNNTMQFSVKPDKIPFREIESVHTDNKSGIIGKPKVFVGHQEGETEFRFYNKNVKQNIEGKKQSLNGKETAERFAELLKNKAELTDKKTDATSGTEESDKEYNSETDSEDDSEGFISKMSKTKEYKRTCNECGEVWHVLASREWKVKTQKASNEMQQCGAALSCCLPMSALSQSNVQSSQEQLDKMRSCPECGSRNYDEETIRYEK